jgi:hypothetical protein
MDEIHNQVGALFVGKPLDENHNQVGAPWVPMDETY